MQRFIRSASQSLAVVSLLLFAIASRAEVPVMEIIKGHSATIFIEEDIGTVALGNPDIAETIILKPNTLLINAKSPGATSLTLFGKSGRLYDYRILVSHDLTLLSRHLQKLDTRIRVETDPNGDAVILSGIAETKEIIERAVDAAIRFFGDASITMSNVLNARAMNDPNIALTPQQQGRGNITANQGAASIGTEQLSAKRTRVINLLTAAESMMPAPKRMEGLLKQVDQRISVELSNSVFILKGNVKTPAELARALTIADRFVSQDERPNIQVISDAGGVLAGDVQAERDQGVEPVDPNLSIQTFAGGNRAGAARGGRGRNALSQPLTEGKGNIAQNLSRGDVITAASGRVMSLIQVDDQPRVEIQMRIVAVDRNKTADMGIDWRLDGTKVHFSSPVGKVINLYPGGNASTGTVNPFIIGDNVTGVIGLTAGSIAINAFLETVESRGAGIALSEPLLTAVSGESTSFLVGGNIPIPTQTTTTGGASSATQTTTNTQFLQYGLKLIARPTILENGKISIVLDQSISEPDYARQIQMLGANIPGFTQKTVSTVTEAEDGETWAVAGLITEDMSESLRQIPFFSNIPVLGALFRSTSDKKTRSELIITVTARRVGARTGTATPATPGAPKEVPPAPTGQSPAATEKVTEQVWP